MADSKISQLPELTTFTGNEDVPLSSNGQNYRAKKSAFGGAGASNIASITGLQAALDAKATPADVTAAVAGKADTSALTSGLAAKADTTTVNTALAGKADNSALTSGLATKAATVHTHVISDVTGLQTALDGKTDLNAVDARIQAVVGAAPAALDTLVEIADKLAADESVVVALTTTVAGKANAVHNHGISDVTGLQAALDAKATPTDISTAIIGKADTAHIHSVADVTGLQVALNSKADTNHAHVINDITGLQLALDGKADAVHTHAYTDISNMKALEDHLRALFGTPLLEGNITTAIVPTVDFDVDITKTNGYALDGCSLVCKIDEDAGPHTETLLAEPIILGTKTYSFSFAGLSNTAYTITVELHDNNQTDVTPVVSITIPVTFAPV